VYGLDYVEAIPAIYEIHAACVAGEDKVVASTGEYVVVAFSGKLSSPPPSIVSSPPRPSRRSSLSVPRSVSSPAVPVRTFPGLGVRRRAFRQSLLSP
jgi:hypothetical protein